MPSPPTEAAAVARKCWRTLEPIHGMIYFVPEAADRYAEVGVTGRSGYFGSRSAAMGAVTAGVVRATFFNFQPDLVARAMDALWDRVTPSQVLDARLRAADGALRRLLGDEVASPQVTEAVALLRPVVDAARKRPEGRPLFAGHAELPEPEAPHLALWHQITLLREFRGDGHIAALVDAGLRGVEALVLHGASGEVSPRVLKDSRAWSDSAWNAAVDELRSRGLLEGDELSTRGTELRAGIEDRTDALAAPAWGAIGVDDAARLRSIVRPWSKAISQTSFGFR